MTPGELPQPGEQVVLLGGSTLRGGSRLFFTRVTSSDPNGVWTQWTFLRAWEEGVTWCRSWRPAAAKALQVARALAPS